VLAPYNDSLRFHPQPELDQAADGLGTAGQIGLFPAPIVQFLSHFRLYPDANQVSGYRRPLLWCFHVNMS
jgi:hypothetical protein